MNRLRPVLCWPPNERFISTRCRATERSRYIDIIAPAWFVCGQSKRTCTHRRNGWGIRTPHYIRNSRIFGGTLLDIDLLCSKFTKNWPIKLIKNLKFTFTKSSIQHLIGPRIIRIIGVIWFRIQFIYLLARVQKSDAAPTWLRKGLRNKPV